jgi:hypothetical protein
LCGGRLLDRLTRASDQQQCGCQDGSEPSHAKDSIRLGAQ